MSWWMNLFVILLWFAFIIVCILFLTSPFSFKKLDVANDTSLIHAQSGSRVDLSFARAPYTLQPWVQAAQMDLLQHLSHTLNAQNVPFWAVKTTLLATVRHGRLIPWEDTVSIALLHDDLRSLVHSRQKLERGGSAVLRATKHGYLYCLNNVTFYPHIEINIMQAKDHEISVCTPTDELGSCSFQDSFLRRNEVFNKDLVFPLQKSTIGTLEIMIPHKPEECLRICFGETWATSTDWSLLKFVFNSNTSGIVRHLFPHSY